MNQSTSPIAVSAKRPCRHCGKEDWCYYFADSGLEVCNRGSIAIGWIASKKMDANGNPYLYKEKVSKTKRKMETIQKYDYPDRHGNPLARSCRATFDNGDKKVFREGLDNGQWIKSCKHINREEIPIYRYAEIREAIADGLQIFWVEGEKCADILWELGIPATTNFGGSKGLKESDLIDLEGASLVICPDGDEPGLKLAAKVYDSYPEAAWLYAYPEHPIWSKGQVPPSEGRDVWDWITEKNLTAEDIYDAVEVYRGDLLGEDDPLMAPEPEQHFTEKAIEALYSQGNYIAVEESLYKFNGKYYEKLDYFEERRRISDWCTVTAISVGPNRWKNILANPASLHNIWAWTLIKFAVSPTKINPPGLNLNNGILEIDFTDVTPKTKLIKHSSDYYYTYLIDVDFDENADDSHANKLLSCLDEGQRLILLRTLAASLNLAKVRKERGRAVRGLLLHGEGNNGKDSLRSVMKILFQESMVNVSMSDFQSYDQGRKFPLAKLAYARISWSSENTKFISLENSSSLKATITGDPIDIELKRENEYSIEPETILLFNCNEPPSLVGATEAILSRWSILSFNKVYKKNADVRFGEIEADPRFRYSPEFLRKSVVPAFLNKILEQFPLLLKEGIDYSPTNESFKELQEENNHLWTFIREAGIQESPGEKLYIKDIWDDLQEWYKANGTIEVLYEDTDREKRIFHDQDNPYDKTIKRSNQLYKAFKEMFPKIKKDVEKTDRSRKNQTYFAGLTQLTSLTSHPLVERDLTSPSTSHGEVKWEAGTQSYPAWEVREVKTLPLASDEELLCEVVRRFADFSQETQQNFTKEINLIYSSIACAHEQESKEQSPFVRYKGEVYRVARSDQHYYYLRYSGFTKIVAKARKHECRFLD